MTSKTDPNQGFRPSASDVDPEVTVTTVDQGTHRRVAQQAAPTATDVPIKRVDDEATRLDVTTPEAAMPADDDDESTRLLAKAPPPVPRVRSQARAPVARKVGSKRRLIIGLAAFGVLVVLLVGARFWRGRRDDQVSRAALHPISADDMRADVKALRPVQDKKAEKGLLESIFDW